MHYIGLFINNIGNNIGKNQPKNLRFLVLMFHLLSYIVCLQRIRSTNYIYIICVLYINNIGKNSSDQKKKLKVKNNVFIT